MRKSFSVFLFFVFGTFCFAGKWVDYLFTPTDTIRFDRADYVQPANDNYVYFTYVNDEGQKELRIKRLDTKVEAILDDSVYMAHIYMEEEEYIHISTFRVSTYITKDLKSEALVDWDIIWGTNFYKDVALIRNRNGYYLINSKGELINEENEIERTSAHNLYDGIFSVTLKDGRAGFMDLKGNLAFEIPREYKDNGDNASYCFWDGVMVLTNGQPEGKHKSAVIDKKGNILGETKYFLSNFSDGLAAFDCTEKRIPGKTYHQSISVFGYMDKYCNIVIPPVFEREYGHSFPGFSGGYAEVSYRGRELLLGKDGVLYSKETKKPVLDLKTLKE